MFRENQIELPDKNLRCDIRQPMKIDIWYIAHEYWKG